MGHMGHAAALVTCPIVNLTEELLEKRGANCIVHHFQGRSLTSWLSLCIQLNVTRPRIALRNGTVASLSAPKTRCSQPVDGTEH